MRAFKFQNLTAAIVFTILSMGVIGIAVILPILVLQWTWNQFIPSLVSLAPINVWQAILLYCAFAAILYLTGLVRVEIDMEAAD